MLRPSVAEFTLLLTEVTASATDVTPSAASVTEGMSSVTEVMPLVTDVRYSTGHRFYNSSPASITDYYYISHKGQSHVSHDVSHGSELGCSRIGKYLKQCGGVAQLLRHV